jgi:hypothetical protein
MIVQETSTHEERVLAALAHAGVLANAFNLLGIVGAAIIWSTQRQKSAYVATHALQALLFQLLMLLLTVLLLVLWGVGLVITILPAIFRPALYPSDLPLAFRVALFGGLIVLLGFILFIGLYALSAALAAWQGRPFRYALVELLLEMQRESSSSSSDSQPLPAQQPASDSQPLPAQQPASDSQPLPAQSPTETGETRKMPVVEPDESGQQQPSTESPPREMDTSPEQAGQADREAKD